MSQWGLRPLSGRHWPGAQAGRQLGQAQLQLSGHELCNDLNPCAQPGPPGSCSPTDMAYQAAQVVLGSENRDHG